MNIISKIYYNYSKTLFNAPSFLNLRQVSNKVKIIDNQDKALDNINICEHDEKENISSLIRIKSIKPKEIKDPKNKESKISASKDKMNKRLVVNENKKEEKSKQNLKIIFNREKINKKKNK